MKTPGVNVDILIVRDNQILLGLLSKKWLFEGKQVYGVPGRDIKFGEKIGQTVRRNIREDLGCVLVNHKIICVNANYALKNHYIGIGVKAEIKGVVKNLVPEDWEEWQWFEKEHLPTNLFPATKNLIESYLRNKMNVCD